MKEYLIRIESNNGNALYTTVYGDTPTRPFMIDGNLWNYKTPWTAAMRLEMLAQSWENHGQKVKRIYGGVLDMPYWGNRFNCGITIYNFT